MLSRRIVSGFLSMCHCLRKVVMGGSTFFGNYIPCTSVEGLVIYWDCFPHAAPYAIFPCMGEECTTQCALSRRLGIETACSTMTLLRYCTLRPQQTRALTSSGNALRKQGITQKFPAASSCPQSLFVAVLCRGVCQFHYATSVVQRGMPIPRCHESRARMPSAALLC